MSKQQQTKDLKTKNPEAESTTTLPAIAAPETLAQLNADIATLAAEANELSDDYRVGDDLKFKKGKWTQIAGDTDIGVGPTTTFVVDVRSYRRGWIKWLDKKPVIKLIARPIDGFISPGRERLGDNNKNQWPRDGKGIPQDPWQENFIIVLRNLDKDRLCTFITTSYYGSRGLGALFKVYARDAKKHPDMDPVVLLSSETKTTQSFGDVEAPVFKVVDWKPFGDDRSPPGMKVPLPQVPQLPKVQTLLPPKQSNGNDPDDEIPF